MASHALWCQSTEVQAAILHHQDSDAIICNALSENIQSAHHKGGKRGICYPRCKIQQRASSQLRGGGFWMPAFPMMKNYKASIGGLLHR
jgi:hypothetical protein